MAGAGARIGTAYIDVEPDFSLLERAVRQAVSRVTGQFDRIGDSAEQSIRSGMQDAAREAERGGEQLAQEGEQAGEGWGKRFGAAAKDAMDKAGVAAGAALAAGLVGAVGAEQTSDKLQAQLGLSSRQSQQAGKVAGKVYANAYGESLQEVNDAVGSVISSLRGMRGATDTQLEAATVRALDFATTFEVDVQRAVQSVGTLLNTGLAKNSKEAFDLITRASQRVPAALREDLLDASDEYGQFFRSLGFNGQQTFEALVAASDKGQFGIDKLGDAVKEFTLLSTDLGSSSVQDAYKVLGLNAEEMSNKILRGGKGAQTATQQIVSALLSIKDPSAQAQTAIALFGTPLEDLNKAEIPEFLRQLQGSGGAMRDFAGAADKMGRDLNDNAGARLEAFKRQALMGIQEVAAKYVLPVLDALVMILAPLAPMLGGVTAAVVAYTIATKGAAAITAAWNVLIAMSPWGRIALAVIGLTSSIAILVAQHRELRDGAANAWASVQRWASGAWSAVTRAAGEALSGLASLPGKAIRLAQTVGSSIVSGVLSGASSLASVLRKSLEASLYTAVTSLSPFSPVEHGGSEHIGKPLAKGAVRGWVAGSGELPATMEESIRNAVERARQTVENARGTFGDAWGRLAGDALTAFDKAAGQIQTPTEKALNDEREQRRKQQLDDAVAEARARLAAAKPEEQKAAQKALDDALFAQREYAAEAQIAEERKELDASQAMRRRYFEDRLAQLQEALSKEGATQGEAQRQITRLLKDFGIDYQSVGQSSGKAFADGLKQSKDAAAAAASEVAKAVEAPLKVTPVKEDKADGGAKAAADSVEKLATGAPVAALATSGLSGQIKNLNQDGKEAGASVEDLKRKMSDLGSQIATGLGVFSGLALALMAARIELVRTAVAAVASRVAAAAVAVATGAWSAAQWALNAALTANPIGLVVVAIAAIVAALVYAWHHSEAFRDAVTAVWNFLKEATTTVWNAIAGFLKGIWEGISGAVSWYFNAYKTIVTTIWDAIKSATSAVWNAIRAALSTTWNGIKAAADLVWDAIRLAILTPIRTTRDVLETIWSAVKTAAEGAWNLLKGAATSAWNFIKDKIVDPIESARDRISELWESIKKRAANAWADLKEAASDFAGGFRDRIVGAFEKARDAVVGLINKIIDVINKIPGVNIAKIKVEGSKAEKSAEDAPGFARGAIVHHDRLAKGAMVTRPMFAVGEQAPSHPEAIIPFNPAYRARALALFGETGRRLGVPGFATGGIFSQKEMEDLWVKAGGPSSQKKIAGAVGMAESRGNSQAVNDIGAGGLWQIHPPEPGYLNPMTNARIAVRKWKESGWKPWEAYTGPDGVGSDGPWRQFIGKGFLGEIVDAVTDPLEFARNLFGDLPSPGDFLPDWLKGLGTYAIDKAKDWIKSKAKSVFGGDGGDLGDSSPVWDSIMGIARKTGNVVTSAYRPGDDGWHGQNRAKDFAGGNMLAMARQVAAEFGSRLLELIHTPLGFGIKNGKRVAPYAVDDHYDHVHVAFQQGGIFGPEGAAPFVGSFRTGGIVPRDGYAYVHQGEEITSVENRGAVGDIYVSLGDGPFTKAVDARIEYRDRALGGAALAGVR